MTSTTLAKAIKLHKNMEEIASLRNFLDKPRTIEFKIENNTREVRYTSDYHSGLQDTILDYLDRTLLELQEELEEL